VRGALRDGPGCATTDAVTMVTEHARALEVFQKFLAFSREAGAPKAATPMLPVALPVPVAAADPHPAITDVSTGVTPWEEPTKERPDVVRAMVAGGAAHPDTSPGIAVPEAPAVVEQSIIVDDDTLTDPEFGRALLTQMGQLLRPPATAAATPMPVEQLVQEMSVLIKYGHAKQAAEETERWIRAHPDDLSAHLKIAEFELARLDREAAINRFVHLLNRLMERGETRSARDVVQRLQSDVREDARVGAIVSRLSAT